MGIACRSALIFALLCAGLAQAHAQVGIGGIVVERVWARATIGVDRPGAIYMTIHNVGTAVDRLLSVSTPVAGRAEIHETTTESGVARMAPAGPIVLRPGDTIAMSPGGLHIMLIDLQQALAEGETITMTLEFARAGRFVVVAPVLGIGALGPSTHTE